MKILTVIGARPQFIKAAPVSKVIKEAGHQEFLVHTGQHYDYGMSQIFFEELGLPQPDVNLNVGSENHGRQTGQMLINVETVLSSEKPDYVLVYGDTNSTLAGALAAIKMHIPLVHVEAGLGSFNREMPEEYNRVLTDHCASLLFCPTQTAVDNLEKEGITKGVRFVGDTMYDAILQYSEISKQRSGLLETLEIKSEQYLLLTVHRASDTDNADNLRNIFSALAKTDETVIFPLHPRTRAAIDVMKIEMDKYPNIKIVAPQSYLDMLMLEKNSRMILTDSGGIQKEAFFFGVPCVTLRSETEWVETVHAGWNVIVGTDIDQIVACYQNKSHNRGTPPALFGTGQAAQAIVGYLESESL